MAKRVKAKSKLATLRTRLHRAQLDLDEAWFACARVQKQYWNETQLTMKLTAELAGTKRRIAKLLVKLHTRSAL